MIIIVLISLFVLFAIAFAIIWFMFFNLDAKTCERLAKTCKKSLETGHYKKAQDLLWILSRKDKNIEIKYQLGVSQLALKEYKKARATFESILKVDKKHAPSLTKMAKLERIEKKYEKALEYYLLSIKIDARNVENFIGIAEIYFENKEYEKALEIYQKAMELIPDEPSIQLSILKCKTELCEIGGELDCQSVVEEFLNNNELSEKLPEYHREIAKVYAKSGDLSKSKEYCEKMLKDKPNDIETLRMMGLLMLLKQDFDSAKSYLTKAFSIDPKSVETHNILSYVVCHQVENTTVRACRLEYYNLVKEYLNKKDT